LKLFYIWTYTVLEHTALGNVIEVLDAKTFQLQKYDFTGDGKN
jgi:hypothetical protein